MEIISIIIKKIHRNMLVIGLLSSEQEANEIKYIAKVCSVEDRIHFIVRMQKIKELLKNHRQSPR